MDSTQLYIRLDTKFIYKFFRLTGFINIIIFICQDMKRKIVTTTYKTSC